MSHDDLLKILIFLVFDLLACVFGFLIGYRIGQINNSKEEKK